jgi:hypothetical protein
MRRRYARRRNDGITVAHAGVTLEASTTDPGHRALVVEWLGASGYPMATNFGDRDQPS